MRQQAWVRGSIGGGSIDLNNNGVPDKCDEAADLDGDGIVGVGDLLILLGAWGPCPDPPAAYPADLDGNGEAAVGDLLMLLGNLDHLTYGAQPR